MAKQSRPVAQVRRSPRAARPPQGRPLRPLGRAAPTVPERPLLAPFAAAFGVLTAAEVLYLVWLLAEPDDELVPAPGWVVAALVALAVWATVGAVLVVLGRWRGWLVLATGSVLPLLGLLAVAVLFGSLGSGSATVWGVLMCVGPLGALVLSCRRPVREWTTR